jgi:hypothetical protein
MNFQDAEKTYGDLKAQHDAGKLSDSTFEAEVGKLRMQDAQGRWWQIGVQTGEWYMHDGQKWNKAKPPIPSASSGESTPVPEITAVIPRPGAKPKAAAPVQTEPAPKKNGGSMLPARLFSSKPAGRNGGGGLSRNALIAIIAGVAIVCILLAIVGYSVLQSQVKGNIIAGLSGTATPTRGLVLPTVPPPPTLPPKPTDTPLPPPTPVVTTTIALPPTATSTRGAAVARTATRTPTAAPKGSPTVSAPPGVYVLKLETDPAKIDVGDGSQKPQVGFKMTMLNTTGGMQTFTKWFVRVFQEPEQTSGDNAYKISFGESLKFDVNVGTGTVEVTTPPHVVFGPGRCNYVAIPYYTSDNNIALPFLKTNGQPLYYSFKVCQ